MSGSHIQATGFAGGHDYRLGPDVDNLTEEVDNKLMEVIVSNWEQNRIRPSRVTFVGTDQ